MRVTRLFACMFIAAVALPAHAGAPPGGPASAAEFISARAVDAARLDAVRGGFALGDALLVTLGIDRIVHINGALVEQSTLQFGDIGKLASGETHLAADALSGARLIQNGQQNEVATRLAEGVLGGTVIQNSLNDQMINSQTTIRATVNNAGVVQTMNFNASMTQALNNSVSFK